MAFRLRANGCLFCLLGIGFLKNTGADLQNKLMTKKGMNTPNRLGECLVDVTGYVGRVHLCEQVHFVYVYDNMNLFQGFQQQQPQLNNKNFKPTSP